MVIKLVWLTDPRVFQTGSGSAAAWRPQTRDEIQEHTSAKEPLASKRRRKKRRPSPRRQRQSLQETCKERRKEMAFGLSLLKDGRASRQHQSQFQVVIVAKQPAFHRPMQSFRPCCSACDCQEKPQALFWEPRLHCGSRLSSRMYARTYTHTHRPNPGEIRALSNPAQMRQRKQGSNKQESHVHVRITKVTLWMTTAT